MRPRPSASVRPASWSPPKSGPDSGRIWLYSSMGQSLKQQSVALMAAASAAKAPTRTGSGRVLSIPQTRRPVGPPTLAGATDLARRMR